MEPCKETLVKLGFTVTSYNIHVINPLFKVHLCYCLNLMDLALQRNLPRGKIYQKLFQIYTISGVVSDMTGQDQYHSQPLF